MKLQYHKHIVYLFVYICTSALYKKKGRFLDPQELIPALYLGGSIVPVKSYILKEE